ncbi:MAG: hypothetical protein MAG458_01350 [Nitrosopumilus sp.]|nr:hypothetical protein [Nitrosopumilus sp.]
MIINNYNILNSKWFVQFPESVAYEISRELCDKLKTDRKSIENEFLEYHIERESDINKIKKIPINHSFSEFLFYCQVAEERQVTLYPPIKEPEEIDGRCTVCGIPKINHSWNELSWCCRHFTKENNKKRHERFLKLFGNSFRNAYDNSQTNHTRQFGRDRLSENERKIWNLFCKNYVQCIFRIMTF